MFTWNFLPFNYVWPWIAPSTCSTLGQCLQCKCYPTIRIAIINSSSNTLNTYLKSISCQPIKKLCSRQQQVSRSNIMIIWIFVFSWHLWNVFFKMRNAFSMINQPCLCFLSNNISRMFCFPSLCSDISQYKRG